MTQTGIVVPLLSCVAAVLSSCSAVEDTPDASMTNEPVSLVRSPTQITDSETVRLAHMSLRPGEYVAEATALQLLGLQETVIVGVAIDNATGDVARTFAIDANGAAVAFGSLRTLDRDLYEQRYGRMSIELFLQQEQLAAEAVIPVDIILNGNFSEPELPDPSPSTDALSDFQAWIGTHRSAQRLRITEAKAALLRVLEENAIPVLEDHAGLPILRVQVSAAALRTDLLVRDDIVELHSVRTDSAELLGYAGAKSMNDGALAGGGCGTGKCSGGGFWVGLWESGTGSTVGGIAMSNTRLGGSVHYQNAPLTCTSDSQCVGTSENAQRCYGGKCAAEQYAFTG